MSPHPLMGARVRVTGRSMNYITPELQPGAVGTVHHVGRADRAHALVKKDDTLAYVVIDNMTNYDGTPELFRWPFPTYDLEVLP